MPNGVECSVQGASNNSLFTDIENRVTAKPAKDNISAVSNPASYTGNSQSEAYASDSRIYQNDTGVKPREKSIDAVEPQSLVNPQFVTPFQNIVSKPEQYKQRIQAIVILFKETHSKLQESCFTINEYIKKNTITKIEDTINLWNAKLTKINHDLTAQANKSQELSSEILYSSLETNLNFEATEEEQLYEDLLQESKSLTESIIITTEQLAIYKDLFAFIKNQSYTYRYFSELMKLKPICLIYYEDILKKHDDNINKTYEDIKNICEDIESIKKTLDKFNATEITFFSSAKKEIINLILILEDNILTKFVDEYNSRHLLYIETLEDKNQLIEKQQDKLSEFLTNRLKYLSIEIDKISEKLFTLTSVDSIYKLNSRSLQDLAATKKIIKTQCDTFNRLINEKQLNILLARIANKISDTNTRELLNKKITAFQKSHKATKSILSRLSKECSLRNH